MYMRNTRVASYFCRDLAACIMAFIISHDSTGGEEPPVDDHQKGNKYPKM